MTVLRSILRDHAVGIHVSEGQFWVNSGSNGRVNLRVHLRIHCFDTVFTRFGTVLALFGTVWHWLGPDGHWI